MDGKKQNGEKGQTPPCEVALASSLPWHGMDMSQQLHSSAAQGHQGNKKIKPKFKSTLSRSEAWKRGLSGGGAGARGAGGTRSASCTR